MPGKAEDEKPKRARVNRGRKALNKETQETVKDEEECLCKGCQLKIGEDDKALLCGGCKTWSCIKCLKIPEALYTCLITNANEVEENKLVGVLKNYLVEGKKFTTPPSNQFADIVVPIIFDDLLKK